MQIMMITPIGGPWIKAALLMLVQVQGHSIIPHYDKHGREILELGSFHNLKLGSQTLYTKEEDDIDARLATLDRKLKGCLDFGVSITHHSVSITHHSKMVGPTEQQLVWICFQILFSSPNSHQSE